MLPSVLKFIPTLENIIQRNISSSKKFIYEDKNNQDKIREEELNFHCQDSGGERDHQSSITSVTGLFARSNENKIRKINKVNGAPEKIEFVQSWFSSHR